MSDIRIILIGVGQIGQMLIRQINQRKGIVLVGAVDSSPALDDQDTGLLAGLPKSGVKIKKNIEEATIDVDADAVILTTKSSAKDIFPHLEQIINCGLPVVTTCEELSYPWQTHPELSLRLDKLAKDHQVSVLAAGVNPGFLMDLLPAVLTGVCENVKSISISRVQDASSRRQQFQSKIGAGLSPENFEKKKIAGSLRHVGLTESIHMLGDALGWKLDCVEETLFPVIAENGINIPGAIPVKAGDARGVLQYGRAYVGGVEKITLEFKAAIGEPESFDRIHINGSPSIDSTIKGGVNGDIATCSIVINAIRQLLKSERKGLLCMTDLPPATWFTG